MIPSKGHAGIGVAPSKALWSNAAVRNQKAKLATDYQDLLRLLSSSETDTVGCYSIGPTIAEGTYGKVKLGKHLLTGAEVAIKKIPKAHVPLVTREIHHHRQLIHPNIAKLLEIHKDSTHIYVITEYCSHGELYDKLVEIGRCSEDQARRWFDQILSAVGYCHERNIVHRDLKLENILLDDRDNIKLCDFGFTREAENRRMLESFCGSMAYSAPEIVLCKKYTGPEADVWSLGVILYALVTGQLPFDDDNDVALQRKILNCEYSMPAHLSEENQDLLRRILKLEPTERLTIEQIRMHGWMRIFAELPDLVLTDEPSPLILPAARAVTAKSDKPVGAEALFAKREQLQNLILSQSSSDPTTHTSSQQSSPRNFGYKSSRHPMAFATSPAAARHPNARFNSIRLASGNLHPTYRSDAANCHSNHFVIKDPLEGRLLTLLDAAGFDVMSIQRSVQNGEANSSSALWFLLLNKLQKEERSSRKRVNSDASSSITTSDTSNNIPMDLAFPNGDGGDAPAYGHPLRAHGFLPLLSTTGDDASERTRFSYLTEASTQTDPEMKLTTAPIAVPRRENRAKTSDSPSSTPRRRVQSRNMKLNEKKKEAGGSPGNGGWLSSMRSWFAGRQVEQIGFKELRKTRSKDTDRRYHSMRGRRTSQETRRLRRSISQDPFPADMPASFASDSEDLTIGATAKVNATPRWEAIFAERTPAPSQEDSKMVNDGKLIGSASDLNRQHNLSDQSALDDTPRNFRNLTLDIGPTSEIHTSISHTPESPKESPTTPPLALMGIHATGTVKAPSTLAEHKLHSMAGDSSTRKSEADHFDVT
ncbi:hypothetical protein BZG36_04184, partial [Bifiguratus adelaidae]